MFSADEMMTVAAARELAGRVSCFVGIGLPSKAANLARRTVNPDLMLIYESGALGAKPPRLPLSIGDGMLAETADAVVGIPEVFNYWLQAGRIEVGFLGAAQVDRYGDINTTVIGDDYLHPVTRLPGAGGAPEIAASCDEVIVVVRHALRSFVDTVDFVTSYGRSTGRAGMRGRGVTRVITNLGVLEPRDGELTLTGVHPGVTVPEVLAATGWPLAVSSGLVVLDAPSDAELAALRSLEAG